MKPIDQGHRRRSRCNTRSGLSPRAVIRAILAASCGIHRAIRALLAGPRHCTQQGGPDNLKHVSLVRLRNIKPGRLGIFSGSLAAQPATVQREVATEIEKLGYGTLWYG